MDNCLAEKFVCHKIPTFSVKRLKTSRTPGCCGISEEHFNCVGPDLLRWQLENFLKTFHDMQRNIWFCYLCQGLLFSRILYSEMEPKHVSRAPFFEDSLFGNGTKTWNGLCPPLSQLIFFSKRKVFILWCLLQTLTLQWQGLMPKYI